MTISNSKETGAGMERNQTEITINQEPVGVAVASGHLGLVIKNEGMTAYISADLAEVSLTVLEGQTFLVIGPVNLGPLTDDAARVLAGMTQPTIH